MNKTTEALKLAEEALEELHYSSGTVKAVTLYKSALAAIREALAEQDKQEPVAEFEVGIGENGEAKFDSFRFMLPKHFPAGQYKLYAAPVSAEAIRAEALEEAAEWCDRLANNGSLDAEDCAAAIRGLK